MGKIYEHFIRPVLFCGDPEHVHHGAIRAAEIAGGRRSILNAATRLWSFQDDRLSQTIEGIRFANPLGLAAGFDKNGRAVHMMGAMGFGHVEIGSVSAWESHGNPERPRLFRVPKDDSIVVYYGVPNEGAEAIRQRMLEEKFAVPVGINLVKTNDPARPAVAPDVYEDYALAMAKLQDCADYMVLNMSCPNSPCDRDFLDDPANMRKLLDQVATVPPHRPVFLKLKPTQDPLLLRDIVAMADEFPFIAGFGINLAAGKPSFLELATPKEQLEKMPGAVSGKPVERYINTMLAELYRLTRQQNRYTLMAAGGIFTAEDAYRKIRLGASLVQLYTGLIYRGPGIIKTILSGLIRLLERDGYTHITEAIGIDSSDRVN